MRRPIAFLAVLLVLCVSIPWAAAVDDIVIQPYWTYLRAITGEINISSDGIATVSGDSTSRIGNTEKMTLIVSLQQFNSKDWKEIKSWTVSRSGEAVSLSQRSWPVAHGYSYRIVITAKAYQGLSLLENGSKTVGYGYFG